MVLVCTQPKFIYLKPRKTAGTSVEMVLEKFCGPPGRTITEDTPGLFSPYGIIGHREQRRLGVEKENLSIWRQHIPAREVRRMVTPAFWDDAAIIATVRNPYDRAVSLFYWLRHLTDAAPLPDFAATCAAFRQWVVEFDALADKPVVHVHGRFAPTHVIRFEHLADDLAQTCRSIGLIDPPELPLTKPRPRRDDEPTTADYFDTKTTDIVRKSCAWMFKAGGYDTALPAPVSAPSLNLNEVLS